MGKSSEIISTVQRRRNWSTEEKVAILEAAYLKGGSVSAAAQRFGVSRSLIYIWRRQVRNGEMAGVSMTEHGIGAFAPVAISGEGQNLVDRGPAPPERLERAARGLRRPGVIEVQLGNGRTIKTDASIEPKLLARLAHALDGNGG